MQKLLLSQLHTFFLVNMFFHLRSIYCFCWRRKEEEGFHTLAVNIKKDVYNSGWLQKKIWDASPIISLYFSIMHKTPNVQPCSEVRKVALSRFLTLRFSMQTTSPGSPDSLRVGETTPWMGFWNNPPPFSLGYIYIIYIYRYIYNI